MNQNLPEMANKLNSSFWNNFSYEDKLFALKAATKVYNSVVACLPPEYDHQQRNIVIQDVISIVKNSEDDHDIFGHALSEVAENFSR